MLDNPPKGCENVAALCSWAANYDYESSPFLKLLDLIGYSEEEFGQPMANKNFTLDYFSADSFAGSLHEWATRPGEVYEFISKLIEADGE